MQKNQRSSDFNLGNISNNTLVIGDNTTLALWNTTNSNRWIAPRNNQNLNISGNISMRIYNTTILYGNGSCYDTSNESAKWTQCGASKIGARL